MAYVDKQLERIDCLLKIVGIELDDEGDDDKPDDIMRLLKGK